MVYSLVFTNTLFQRSVGNVESIELNNVNEQDNQTNNTKATVEIQPNDSLVNFMKSEMFCCSGIHDISLKSVVITCNILKKVSSTLINFRKQIRPSLYHVSSSSDLSGSEGSSDDSRLSLKKRKINNETKPLFSRYIMFYRKFSMLWYDEG